MPCDISGITGAIMVGIALIGSMGNFLTLFVIIRHRPLHDITGMFLANLAAADLLQSSFGMPLIATSAFHNSWIFGDTLCYTSGVTNSLFCIASMLTLSAIGLDRWLVIVYPLRHQSLLTFRRATLVLMYIWVQALVVAIFPVFGWSRYIYLSYEYICTVQWEYDKPYTIFLCVTCFVTPLIVTVVCYASVMKVACRQAHEKPPTMVGEIEAEHSFMATYNQSIHIPDVDEPAMTDEKQMGIGKIRRAEWGPQSVGEEAKSANSRCNSDRESNSDGDMIFPAEINRQKEYNKKEKGPTVGFSTAFKQEANVSVLRDGNAQEIMSKKSAKSKNQTALDNVERSPPNSVRVANEEGIPREISTKFTERSKKDRKMNLSVLTERNVFINPAGALSRIHPTYSSERSAGWIREKSFKSKLGIIPEEKERKDWEDSPMSHARGGKISLGHLARVREWMCVRLTNKEKTETVLKRKKDMKVVLTLLVVNGTFVLCWLPHFIGITCLTFTNGLCPIHDDFFTITTMLAMLNSGCNPFIYTLTYRKFRRAFKKVFPWLRSSRTGNINSSAE